MVRTWLSVVTLLICSECLSAQGMGSSTNVVARRCGTVQNVDYIDVLARRQRNSGELARKYAPHGVVTEVIAVPNRFFGESITVTGLIVGRDSVDALHGHEFDRVLISGTMLRENTECFLDDMTLSEVREIIGKPITVVENDGDAFIHALRVSEVEHE